MAGALGCGFRARDGRGRDDEMDGISRSKRDIWVRNLDDTNGRPYNFCYDFP